MRKLLSLFALMVTVVPLCPAQVGAQMDRIRPKGIAVSSDSTAVPVAGQISTPDLITSSTPVVDARAFAGADWCAKVTAANASLGSTPGEILVTQGAGTSACAAAPTLSAYHTLHFIQAGVYAIGVGWTITSVHDFGIECAPGTVLSFTGAAGFTVDGSALGNGSRRDVISNCMFSGNASVADAVTLNKVVESTFTNLTGMNATATAIHCKGCLENTFISPRSSTNNNLGPVTYSTIPAVGISLDTNGPIASNSNHLVAPVIEGLAGAIGISIPNGSSNVVTSGSTEGNGTGISIGAAGSDNEFVGIDEESNTIDISDSGPRNKFTQMRAFAGTSTVTQLLSGANDTRFVGGTYHSITIASGVVGTSLIGVTYSAAGAGGGITDAGTQTTKLATRNLFTGAYDPEQFAGSAAITSAPPVGANGSTGWKRCDLPTICDGVANSTRVFYNAGNAWASFFSTVLPNNDATGTVPDTGAKYSILVGKAATYQLEGTAPTALAGSDVCYPDSTAHALKCNYNNGTNFHGLRVTEVGTCTMAAGTCTATWGAAFNATPIVSATWNGTGTFTTGASLKCTATTTNSVCTSSTGTDTAVIMLTATGNPN
jgi:hypothetical protein